jgi:adenylate kinase
MNLVIFGPPGAGKGTQSKFIVKKFNLFQLSTGDLLRNEIKNKSKVGVEIASIVNAGSLVSDEIVNKLLKNTILNLKFRDRIIFDGYPRSIEQAKNLDLILNQFNQKIDLIISLVVSREIIEKRIIGRVTCDKCNLTLNEFFNKEEIDLHPCGKEFFVKRNDDNLETIMSRYDIYTKTTEPVLNFLSKNSNFQEIDGTLKIDEITRKIDTFINV